MNAAEPRRGSPSRLLDHDLGSRRKVDFDPADLGMTSLALEVLVPGEPSPTDLFLPLFNPQAKQVEMNPVCQEGEEFRADWRERLLKAHQKQVFVKQDQIGQVNAYFESFVSSIMSQPNQSLRKKAMALREMAEMSLRGVFGGDLSQPALENTVGQAKRAIGHMTSDPKILTHLGAAMRADYGVYTRSVNVCTMVLSLGRFMGLSEAMIQSLGMAGMLHDLGYAKLPRGTLRKTKLTPEDRAKCKAHTRLGYQMLLGIGAVPFDALMAVLHHHEMADGSGYPSALPEARIPYPARILRIVDAFDTMTGPPPLWPGNCGGIRPVFGQVPGRPLRAARYFSAMPHWLNPPFSCKPGRRLGRAWPRQARRVVC